MKLRPFRPARAGRTETLAPPAAAPAEAPRGERVVDLRALPPGMLAIPAGQTMPTHAVMALNSLSRALPPGSVVSFGEQAGSAAANRNHCVLDFLAQPHLAWLLFCDSDAAPPKATFAQLWTHEVEIVSGAFLTRNPPYHLAARALDPALHELPIHAGLQEVGAVGFHCVLLRRTVLERMPSPWFEDTAVGVGEDYHFCDKARALGFRVFMDSDLEVGHVAMANITFEFAAAWRAGHKADLEAWQVPERKLREEYAQRCAVPRAPIKG